MTVIENNNKKDLPKRMEQFAIIIIYVLEEAGLLPMDNLV